MDLAGAWIDDDRFLIELLVWQRRITLEGHRPAIRRIGNATNGPKLRARSPTRRGSGSAGLSREASVTLPGTSPSSSTVRAPRGDCRLKARVSSSGVAPGFQEKRMSPATSGPRSGVWTRTESPILSHGP